MTQDGAPLDEVSFSDFLDDYFAECDEHLMGVRRLLLALETSIGREPINRTVLDDLFRHFHSLKGISGMVDVRPAEELAHRLEDYLRALRSDAAAFTHDGLEALFDGTQTLEQVIAARRAGVPVPSIDAIAARVARLVATATTTSAAGSRSRPRRRLSEPHPEAGGRERTGRGNRAAHRWSGLAVSGLTLRRTRRATSGI